MPETLGSLCKARARDSIHHFTLSRLLPVAVRTSVAMDSDESDPEDIDYNELNTSSDEEKEEETTIEKGVSMFDLVAHEDIQSQLQDVLDEKERLKNLAPEVAALPEESVIRHALIQLLVYKSDTLFGVYTPGGVDIKELTLACGYCRTLPSVRNIILAGNGIGPDAADPICWCLTNQSVRSVDISNNPLTDVLVRQVGKILRIQNEVLVLSKHCEFAHEAVFHREADKTALEKIVAQCDEALEQAVEALEKAEGATWFSEKNKLKKLEECTLAVTKCEADEKRSRQDVVVAKEAILASQEHLADMETRLENKIKVLKNAPGMRVLRPQSSEKRLQDMVGSGCRLERLVLSGCKITDIGGIALAAALRGHCSLKTLTLSDNQLTSVTAVALAEHLKVNKTLETLDLGVNKIGDDGGIALATWVSRSPSAVRVMLNKNLIGEGTYKAFTKAFYVQIDISDTAQFRLLNLTCVPDLVSISKEVQSDLQTAVTQYEDTFSLSNFVLNMQADRTKYKREFLSVNEVFTLPDPTLGKSRKKGEQPIESKEEREGEPVE